MELCIYQAMSKLTTPHSPRLLLIANPNHLHCKYNLIPLRQSSLLSPAARGLHSRLVYFPKRIPRATTSEETSSGANQCADEATSEETLSGASQFTGEKRDSVIILEDVPPVEKNRDSDVFTTEATKEVSPGDELKSRISEFLDKLNGAFINLIVRQNFLSQIDSEDTYSYLLYGGGAAVAFWLASAVVGAIDSIPLFPKFLEIVGLGYTAWFTYRYLLFKKNREELFAKFEELKEEVLGSDDD